MDDWNDFGPPEASRPPLPPSSRAPLPLPSSSYPRSDSTPSTFGDSASDSSVALIGSRSSSSSTASSGSSYIPPPTDSATDPSHTDPTDHSSFLSSIPFLGTAAARSRKADRQAAVAAAAALADGRLAATPALVVPLDRSAHADRVVALDHLDHVSAASDSDGVEPASRRLPPSSANRRDLDPEDESFPRLTPPRRRGALDDVPPEFELNIQGFRYQNTTPPASFNSEMDDPHSSVMASSLLRRVDKSYTKLEVITAKQIRNMLLIFNIFVLIGLVWTITTIALSHSRWEKNNLVPIPEALLYPEHIQNAPQSGTFPLNDAARAAEAEANAEAAAEAAAEAEANARIPPRLQPPSVRESGSFEPADSAFPEGMGKPFREVMAAQGLYISRRGSLSRGPVVPLTKDTGIVLGRNGHPNRPCSNCLAVIDTSGRQWRNDTSLPHLRSDQVTDSGGEEPRFVRVFLMEMFVAIAPYRFKMISHVMSCTLSVFFYVLGILFAVRLCRQGRRSTSHEQIWVLILIFITSFYFNVYESVIRILEETDPNRSEDKFDKWVFRLEEVLTGSRDLAFTVFTFFYLWASLHSYRILDPTKPLAFKTFYLPKLLVLVPYVIFRLVCLFVLSMHLSEVPVMSAPALLFTFGEFNMWRYLKAELLYCIASSVIELMIVGLIVYEALKSLRILRKAPYMKHRTKRVGFRFFIYLNFLFYPSFIFLQALTMFARDKGENILLIIPGVNMPMADPIWYYTMGPAVLVVGYVVVTAHVHLPATSVGAIKGWFKSSALAESGSRWSFGSTTSRSTHANYCVDSTPTPFSGSSTWVHDENTPRSVVDNDNEMDHQIVEPFTYRMKESPHSLELKANCFTMQTHVILFNFAWYVYYYGTPKLNNWKTKENPLPFEYKIAAHIKCDSTDTQVLVLDCFDRIIVAFKGSTSKRNMRTSLQMNYENVHSVIRTNIRGEDETGRLKRMFGRSYTNGKVHRGFAIAYRSVAGEVMEKVRALRGEKRRPIFLTGHSLGGALATICSMDVWVKLELSRREIFVSTFGSPRVGNADFADIYDKVVPLHWRIVVDPDMVAKLPKGGYKHVGKKAVLTPHGDMIIDPNYLDRRPWSGETAGFAYHRKASYLLAMRAWCVRNHGMVYTPVFWPFPLRKEDHKRFESAFTDEGEIVKGHSNRIASKIIHMDAMVDALGHGDQALANMAVVEKWARLTRRILLNARLTENTSFEFQ